MGRERQFAALASGHSIERRLPKWSRLRLTEAANGSCGPRMLNSRQIHRYLSVFFTPAILFFSFSGALQTFHLHESAQRGAPPPVAWIAEMASLHKDQHLLQARPRLASSAPVA